jgi:hypothetical protein
MRLLPFPMTRINRLGALLLSISFLASNLTFAQGAQATVSKPPKLSPQLKLIDGLISSIKSQVKVQSPESITVLIDPPLVGSGWAADTTSNLGTALKLLRFFGFSSSDPLKAYVSWGPEFKNQFVPEHCRWNSGGGSCGKGVMFADIKWFTDMWNWKDSSKSKYPDLLGKISVSANLPHEIGHVLQESAGEKSGTHPELINPAWLREGTAEFFKLMTYSIQNNVTYSSLRNQYLKYWGYCKNVKLEGLTSQESYKNSCEYTSGLVAVEYLIWKKKSLDALYSFQLASGSTQSSRFQNAFNLTQTSFQKEADKYFVASTSKISVN